MKKYYNLGIFLLIFSFSLLFSVVAKAVGNYGLDDTAAAAGLNNSASLPTLIGNVIGTGLAMIGVVFFVLMVYAGVLWMTARGNETTSKKAFDTIVAAAIGMVIVLASYALTNFVFTSVATGGSGGGSGVGVCGVNVPEGISEGCEATGACVSGTGFTAQTVGKSCADTNFPVCCQITVTS